MQVAPLILIMFQITPLPLRRTLHMSDCNDSLDAPANIHGHRVLCIHRCAVGQGGPPDLAHPAADTNSSKTGKYRCDL